MTSAVHDQLDLPSNSAAFLRGLRHPFYCATSYALLGTFVGTGALVHDYGFALGWSIVLNVVVWAGPAQLVLISLLGTGASWLQIAIAVGLSGVRLFPMAVTLLPQLRDKDTPRWHLLPAAHFTAVAFMIESIRAFPRVPRPRRIAFCNGYGVGLGTITTVAMVAGFELAGSMPPLIAVGLLFLAPCSFLLSAAAGCRDLADWLALCLGLGAMPVVALAGTGLEILICGLGSGTVAYVVGRWRRGR